MDIETKNKTYLQTATITIVLTNRKEVKTFKSLLDYADKEACNIIGIHHGVTIPTNVRKMVQDLEKALREDTK